MFDSLVGAKGAVERGKAWAALHFPANFTDNIFARINDGQHADNDTLLGSEVNVWLDNSSKFGGSCSGNRRGRLCVKPGET